MADDVVPLYLTSEERVLWELVTVARGYAVPTANALRELAKARAALLEAEFPEDGPCQQRNCRASHSRPIHGTGCIFSTIPRPHAKLDS